VTVTIRSTTVGEEDGNLVDGLGNEGEEVPESIGVTAVGLGIALLCVNEIWELGGVANEENWSVVTNHIPVTFFSIELDCETTGVASSVSATLLTTDSGETKEDGSLLANLVQELGLGNLAKVVSDLKDTMGTGTLGVDNTLRDTFSVEVSELINKMEILKQDRSPLSSSLGSLVVLNRVSVGGCEVVVS